MKWCRRAGLRHPRSFLASLVAALAVWGAAARGELREWVENVEATGRLGEVFFRPVALPSGTVAARRPPQETRAALTELIAAGPADAELVALRAREAEEQLDFVAAEADWKQFAQLAVDPAAGHLALADFYHRRLRPLEEVPALALAAQAPPPASERLVPVPQQRSWRAFQRIFSVIEAHALSPAVSTAQYRAWMARYPREAVVRAHFFEFLVARKQFVAAEQLIVRYQKAFPADQVFPVWARATLERRRGSAERALAVYDREFRPLWPPELVRRYFVLLRQTRGLRNFLNRARAAVAAQPDDLNAAARVFYYYQQQGNLEAARRALEEFRLRKESRKATWTSEELWTLARLSEGVHDYGEAARFYYALYSLPGAEAASSEKALAGIIHVLLTAPEQPIRFAAGDLSFYRDVATMDPYPGFLNGILSLVLNSTEPASRFADQERASVAYFHRARASELLVLLDSRFPASRERAVLHAKLLEAYMTYGDADGVIRGGRKFLAAFPRARERTRVALLLAESFARKRQLQEEFATYDALLKELAARAGGVPLGAAAEEGPAETFEGGTSTESEGGHVEADEEAPPESAAEIISGRARRAEPRGPRSPDYARVLDRYISRLVSIRRVPQALALYRRELDHNPNDPGLYERLAAFLDQNRLGEQVEQVYRRAIQQFPERTWHHKLARWYLRRKQAAAFERLTQEVVGIFTGNELEKYFREVVGQSGIDPVLYRQVNLYAHQRFPHNLTFVRNLLTAYTHRETYDAAAWDRLLRSHWFYDDGLRSRFFEYLSRTGRLYSELEAVRASQAAAAAGRWQELVTANPAAAQFLAEGEAWQSHFERAAPVLGAMAGEYPADFKLGRRAAAMHRSLAAFLPEHTERAVTIEENLHRSDPRDLGTLARLGEILADREMVARAKPYWDRIAQAEPGKPGGYLEAATVFWDYYLFDDALRLMRDGRKKLSKPALYAYEAGAVYENKRDFLRAVEEYVRGALAAEGDSPARARLLELAKRPAHRATVEQATAKGVSGPNPRALAVSLRVAVLEAQHRRNDLKKFLLALVEGAPSWELLESVDRIAEQQGFETVRERSLERQIALATDPVDRMRLRLTLARFHEGRRDIESARRVLEALDQEHPTVLGVVRATVDFYWRNKMAAPAVDRLVRAAGVSHPALKTQFTFEAGRKSTEAGEYLRARDLLAPLLEGDPFHPEYLAAMAGTYARAGDDRALRDFYTAKIRALREAPQTADERIARIAALRRGLIPALTRLKDPAAALDQYIEIINRYPEDEALLQEAASYALSHNRQKQLVGYYAKTAAESPRDFRWPMVLARLETHFENFPGGIAAYARATEIRPDRTDLHEARAALEDRLMRFEDAVRSYTRLYELTYRNPQWMEKVAAIRARQGMADGAVEALRQALVEGRPERPQNFFDVARKLESWDMLAKAREFAERGLDLARSDLLVDSGYLPGAELYARVMTRLRDHEAAFARLRAAEGEAKSDRARGSFQSALREMGAAVERYFTPDEKSSFVAFLERQRPAMEPEDFAQTLLPLAQSAGLADLEARWRHQLMMAAPGRSESQAHLHRLSQLQKRRMKFAELAAQLEGYWKVYPHAEGKDSILDQVAASYQSAGDDAAELRVLSLRHERTGLSGERLERYFKLLLARDPQHLVAIARADRSNHVRNAALSFAVASGDRRLALDAVSARGSSRPTVWSRVYTGLVGLYYAGADPEVNAAFVAALGAGTIGERVGKPVNRDQQLAGDLWFYYGSRYGEYLGLTKQPNPEDYLPASLERTPAGAAAYFALAEYYRESGDFARALGDYERTLELDPGRGDAHDRVATVLWEQGKRDEATARWKSALAAFMRVEDQARLPETFWADARATLENIGKRKLLPAMREDADGLLRTYIRRSGTYRVEPFLRGALAASADSAAGIAWILDLARAAANPVAFLGEIAQAKWIPETDRGAVFRRVVEFAENQVGQAHGEARIQAIETLVHWRVQELAHLVAMKQTQRAQAALDGLAEEVRRSRAHELAPLEIRLAARSGRLEALLERYRNEPEKTPPLEYIRNVAATLRSEGDNVSARRVLEFVYTNELEQHNLNAANFLGLAEVRLETGDPAGALALLRRMTLVSGEAFENLEPAAALLEKAGRHAEAMEFRAARVRAVPWDARARLELADAQIAAVRDREQGVKLLASVVESREAPYATRVGAALSLGRAKGGALKAGSAELGLLAVGSPADAAAAEQPFFYYARLEAARQAGDLAARMRLLLGAVEIEPNADAPRLSLFRAALDAGRHQLAVSSLEPVLESSGLHGLLDRSESASLQDDESPYESEWYVQQFFSQGGLDAAQRASVARGLADAFQKLDRLSAAELFFRIALELEPSSDVRAELKVRFGAVKAERERRAQDAMRRPIVTDNIDQDRPVRPRLVARGGFPGPAIARR